MPLQDAFTLNANEIFGSIANMIISQEVYADNIGKHQTLVDKARVDGGLFGDKKLYYATDVLKTVAWGNDSEATNLLALHRPAAPSVQDIDLDVFRQICLTVDNYLTKRAWSSEGAFSSFNSVMLGWMRETKKVYDGTLYNVFIGTNETGKVGATAGLGQQKTIALGTVKRGEAIAEGIANLLVEMSDYSRDFNDYGYLRSYDPASVKVIWNSKYVNEIKKVDTPTIFHKEGLVDKLDEEVLPARYFGVPNGVAKTAADSATRSLVEQDITISGAVKHFFPGDVIPSGTTLVSDGAIVVPSYQLDATIICKICVKLPPYMSAFEAATSFFNAKSLTENHYLTFGHNTVEHLKNYPFITVREAEGSDVAIPVAVKEMPEEESL